MTSDRGFKSRLSKASLSSHKSDHSKMQRGREHLPHFQGSRHGEPNFTSVGLKPGESGQELGKKKKKSRPVTWASWMAFWKFLKVYSQLL